MATTTHTKSFVSDFTDRLHREGPFASDPQAAQELPKYSYEDEDSVKHDFVWKSSPRTFHIGTGASIYTSHLLPAILTARHEVILVTCFWAESDTLTALRETLIELASRRQKAKAAAATTGTGQDEAAHLPRLRISICFSSRGFFQRLLHTSSQDGHVYSPAKWSSVLGLPEQHVLKAAGIDLTVKSLFFFPLSVMHPKFVIIDRKQAFVPSCNISWEPWLEGCIEISGTAVDGLLDFYAKTWDRSLDLERTLPESISSNGNNLPLNNDRELGQRKVNSTVDTTVSFDSTRSVTTLILPSSHHRNPNFRPFPWQSHPTDPATPLNVATRDLLFPQQRSIYPPDRRRSIYIQTPNLTSETVMASLLQSLRHGVDVKVVTGRNMMWIEQLATSGTTTSRCIAGLVKRYNALQNQERPTPRLGRLQISYYRPLSGSQAVHRDDNLEPGPKIEEPVQSHLKLTIVDEELVLMGSGNMDRASWFTSQELGILFYDAAVARKVREAVDRALEGRLDLVFDSKPVVATGTPGL